MRADTTLETRPAEPAHDDVRWLARDEQVAWRSFIYGTTRVLEYLSQVLESAEGIDLSLHEYEILVRLSETEGRRIRMSDLAEQVVHSRSRLTHTIARLERRGLVERMRSAEDGRGREAVLTEEGFALLERAAPHHVESVRRALLDTLGRDDFITLGRLLDTAVPPGGQIGEAVDKSVDASSHGPCGGRRVSHPSRSTSETASRPR